MRISVSDVFRSIFAFLTIFPPLLGRNVLTVCKVQSWL